jgi:hypothetical protein
MASSSPVETTGQSEPQSEAMPYVGVSVSIPLSRATAASISSLEASATRSSSIHLEPHAKTAENFELVKKTSKKSCPLSVWWSAFHVYAKIDAKPKADHPRRGRQYCCCNECGEDYLVDETGATGGLMRHMEKDHKKAYAELFNQSTIGKRKAAATSQPDIRASFLGCAKKTKSAKREECAELTTKWVVKTLQPYTEKRQCARIQPHSCPWVYAMAGRHPPSNMLGNVHGSML